MDTGSFRLIFRELSEGQGEVVVLEPAMLALQPGDFPGVRPRESGRRRSGSQAAAVEIDGQFLGGVGLDHVDAAIDQRTPDPIG